MSKQDRLSFIRSRWRAVGLGATMAIATSGALKVQSTSDDRDAQRRIGQLTRERLPAMDDSIAEVDNVEIPISRFVANEEQEEDRWDSSLLTAHERKQLVKEVSFLKSFRRDVLALPLRLTA